MPKIPQTVKPAKPLEPYWQTSDKETVRLYLGHVTDVLDQLPEQSVHMCVTSPPYWGLRDYQTGTWLGGDSECDHVLMESGMSNSNTLGPKGHLPQTNAANVGRILQFKSLCGKCGAVRDDKQLGSEPSPDCGTKGQAQCGRCFVCSMVAVFRGVRRILRDDGTLWLNLGDTYGGYSESRSKETASDAVKGKDNNFARLVARNSSEGTTTSPGVKSGLKSGNMVGVPWRVALALQEDGWILRQEIIWHKPSPMPESVRNRCTKAHEHVFLFAKRVGYFYDAEAIKTAAEPAERLITGKAGSSGQAIAAGVKPSGNGVPGSVMRTGNLANRRSVWRVSSPGYAGAHFATYPPKLIEPMILAGTSEYGCCADCGAPWDRMTHEEQLTRERLNDYVKRTGEEGTGNHCANSVAGVSVKTIGWKPTCSCYGEGVTSHDDHAETTQAIVFDPFIGSGTTACVALANGRSSVGIDLSETYLRENAVVRIEGEILARPDLLDLLPRKRKAVSIGQPIGRK